MTPMDLGVDIAPYVPGWIRASVAEAGSDDGAPSAKPRHAAVLLLDIAGFTEITDRLAQQGERGAEQLSELLNACFAILTDVVDAHGGDIATFTGDGFLALWEASEYARAGHIAAQCALALREAMDNWARSSNSGLRQRISVDVGRVYYCKLGGYGGAWRYAVVGTPFQNVGLAYRKARVGQVLLCGPAWRAIAEHCDGEPRDGVFDLGRLNSAPEVKPLPPIPEIAAPEYRSLVPAVVLDRLGMGTPRWLAEFRNVSVLYVNFLGANFDEDVVNFLQPCISVVQRVASGLDGAIFGVWMDDKGICAALVFGAPPVAHEEDPLRAIEAGLRIQEELRRCSVRASIGIGSGKLFCGDYGGRSRRDYGVIGPAMNTAARLMEIADGGVLCDAATAQAVEGRVGFAVMQPKYIKGRTTPAQLYRPIGILKRQQAHYFGEVVGRDNERRELRATLDRVRAGTGGLVIVQGEPGIGKSRLLSDLATVAHDEGVLTAQGYASAIDKSTPYFAWRQVLLALIEADPDAGNRPPKDLLAARLLREPTLISWLPLLNDIVPIAAAETPLTEQITGAARAASIEALVVGLLLHSGNSPRIIIFEDLHWFDEASLNLLMSVIRRLPQLLVVASRRSPESMAATEARLATRRILEISLGELPADAVAEIIRRRLRASVISSALVSFVQGRAGGNPFYCEELVSALRDGGAISLERGVWVTKIESLMSNMALPASLESAIVTRVDALRPEAQLLLKVASAFGGPFTAEVLHGVYPGAASMQDIEAMLDQLVEQELLRVHESRAMPHYEFRHVISKEVSYSLLPFVQRRLLHAAIAVALEGRQAGHLEPYYGQLARHWEGADDKPRAIEYLERAAEQALRSYANHDAIRHIQRAFELSKESGAKIENERFSRWETILGDAYNELADYDQSLPHYERALLLAGQRVVRSSTERAVGLINNVAVQGWLRLAPARLARLRTVDKETSQRVAHIRERLAERHFFRNESAAVLDETLAAVNLAERGGASTEMISGYSALAIGLGMSGFRGPARFYQKRAMGLADKFELTPESARAYLLAAVLGFGIGEWESTQRFARRSLSVYSQLGDRARALTPLTILASVHVLRGELEEADRIVIESSDPTIVESTSQGKAWRLTAKVMISAIRGSVDMDDVGQLNEVADANLTRADQLLCFGTVASGYLRRGEMSNALAAAERGFAVLRETGTVWGNYVYGVSGVIEVFLAHWAMENKPAAISADVRDKALLACKYARRATRASPVCQPQSLLLSGRSELLSARPGSARRMWMKAAIAAERLQMRREHGLALCEIGRLSSPGDPARSSNLSRAAEIFAAIGAKADLAAAQEALSL